MYGPIVIGRHFKGKVDWRNFNALCTHLLGYAPEPGIQLSKQELHKLGFLYAAGTRKFTSTVYGPVTRLLY